MAPEKNVEALLACSCDWIWESDSEGVYRYSNSRVTDILGYKLDEVIGRPCSNFLSKQSKDILAACKKYFNAEQPIYLINKYLHKNGDIVQMQTKATPFFSDKGILLGYRGSHKNITTELECKERLNLLSDIIKVGYWELNLKESTQVWSDEVYGILGESAQSFEPTMENFMQFLSNEDQCKVKQAIQEALQTHSSYDLFHSVTRKDGSIRHVHARAKLVYNEFQEPIRLFGTVLDITEETLLQEEVHKTFHTLNSVIDNVENLIFYKDINYRYMGCNQAFEAFYGRKREELVGYDDFAFLPKYLAEHFRKLDTLVIEKKQKVVNPQWVKYPDGRDVFLHTTTAPFFDRSGNIIGLVGNAVDITNEKLLSDRLLYKANYDDLTNIPNRTLFMDRLEQAVKHARRRNSKFALFFMDLDKFKAINDNYGHAYGDEVLKEVSHRLAEGVRNSDTVARLGGDEFAVILSDLTEEEDALSVALKLIKIIDTPISVNGLALHVTLSIGIAFYPVDAKTSDNLLKVADHAMYQAKRQGKNCYALAYS